MSDESIAERIERLVGDQARWRAGHDAIDKLGPIGPPDSPRPDLGKTPALAGASLSSGGGI